MTTGPQLAEETASRDQPLRLIDRLARELAQKEREIEDLERIVSELRSSLPLVCGELPLFLPHLDGEDWSWTERAVTDFIEGATVLVICDYRSAVERELLAALGDLRSRCDPDRGPKRANQASWRYGDARLYLCGISPPAWRRWHVDKVYLYARVSRRELAALHRRILPAELREREVSSQGE